MNETYNSYHNEFKSNVTKNTLFILSALLKSDKKQRSPEDTINLMKKIQKSIQDDNVTQQKYLTIFTILNNLIKILTYDKNIESFISQTNKQVKQMSSFLKNSIFTVFLIQDQVIELVDAIPVNILENSKVSSEIRVQALSILFKIAKCFKMLDVYLNLSR